MKSSLNTILTKKPYIIGGILLVAIVAVAIIVLQTQKPSRTVANYCSTYRAEKTRLSKLPGDSWPSGVFDDSVGDAGELVASFGRLEMVAPQDIRGEVATLKSVYQKINDDPSQSVSASMAGVGADSTVKTWTLDNCK